MIVDNDLLSMQQARILAEDAAQAQKGLAAFPQEKLDAIVAAMAKAALAEAYALAVMSHEETDSGKWQDKLVKNRFVCENVHKQIADMRCVGIINNDRDQQVMDIGVPVGVIAALCPVTSPVSTTIYKALLAIKAGNAMIFSPHPSAPKSMRRVLDIMIGAAEEAGMPQGCLSYLDTVTKSGTLELMNHPAVTLIMATGVPGMLDMARGTGKPVVYGGTGNGPAFVERTADIRQAVTDIIASKTFDHGIAPSAEHSIVVDSCIAQDVRRVLCEHGAYFMTDEESVALAEVFFTPEGCRRKGMVGQSVEVLAKRAGISIPQGTTVLVANRKYVSEADPYSRELLAPVLAFYVEDDWMHACEKCIELLLHERNAHTLVIHSGDEEVIRQFALKKPVGRLLVNTPATFGGIGATTNLFPSMTLGSSNAGRGITADNVSPQNLTYIRKVGYGVRSMNHTEGETHYEIKPCVKGGAHGEDSASNTVDAIQRILKEAIEALGDHRDR